MKNLTSEQKKGVKKNFEKMAKVMKDLESISWYMPWLQTLVDYGSPLHSRTRRLANRFIRQHQRLRGTYGDMSFHCLRPILKQQGIDDSDFMDINLSKVKNAF